MVNTADGYDYVTGANVDAEHPHGDLDRIIVDGEIMPLRTGNTSNVDANGSPIPRANILRGEDIAFLMEFANQRRFAATGGTRISGGETVSFEGAPRKLDSLGKSWFNRKLLPAMGYSNNCSFFPHAAFSDLADATKITSTSEGAYFSSALLFGEISSSSQFAVPCGTSSLNLSTIRRLIYEKYGGEAFDASGLTNPASGGILLKQTVLDYFSKAAAITDKGVGLMEIGGGGVMDSCSFADADSTDAGLHKYQRSVGTWTGSTETTDYGGYIPQWGVCEYDFDSGDTYIIHVYQHRYGYGYPPSGCDLLSVNAPHGDHAVAICAFVVTSYNSATQGLAYDIAVLLKPYVMTKDGSQTFTLKSDAFASSSSVDEIVSASGVSFPADTSTDKGMTSHFKRASISLYVVPVVYFDDHTRWT